MCIRTKGTRRGIGNVGGRPLNGMSSTFKSSSVTTPLPAKRRKPRMADIAESQVVDEDVRLRKEFLEVKRMKAQLERDCFEREEKDKEAARRKDKAMVALLTKLVADGHK
ncbi:hypothetical protein M427DRAFT_65112 [Gonapodya prolifera JEL478]|uniref:Uncharacterized protein n=1 Tax=Gonapodya prolifera (strain JEL478) TaxID=1344416 RepID=A0A138ZW61_GONPJ|nr:hypothetical protein M427DRAFT_65112 [Gonapodya prolifera JEL478]|eukprot:KXS08769.1 hypothetical protein M427DRAFT_65112 [Gonapodya prolifera JEL478]